MALEDFDFIMQFGINELFMPRTQDELDQEIALGMEGLEIPGDQVSESFSRMRKVLENTRKERMIPVQPVVGQQGAQANNMSLGAQRATQAELQAPAPVQGGLPTPGLNQRSFQLENQLRNVKNRVASLRQSAKERQSLGLSASEGRESRKRKLNLSPGRSARRS